MTEPNRIRWRGTWLIGLVVLFLVMSALYLAGASLLAGLYHWLGWSLPNWLARVIEWWVGLTLTLTVLGAVGHFSGRRGRGRGDLFSSIIEALERISRGDFRVRLDEEHSNNQVVGQLAASVNKVAAELEQMEALRQEFISNVSHEIQSPLTSIHGFTLALQNDDLSPAERHHYLEIIEAESTRLSRVTDNLLRLSLLESDQVRFDPKTYRLDRQIRALLLACEPRWIEKQLELSLDLDETEVFGDEDLLSQVWSNLIYNSIKFTPSGGRIELSLRQRETTVEFQIQDTGIGIAPEDFPRIFERFYKAEKSRTGAHAGSGLGLSIAKKIVAMHHGEISASSRLGEGAVFTVRLPRISA